MAQPDPGREVLVATVEAPDTQLRDLDAVTVKTLASALRLPEGSSTADGVAQRLRKGFERLFDPLDLLTVKELGSREVGRNPWTPTG